MRSPISSIGMSWASWAISRLDFTLAPLGTFGSGKSVGDGCRGRLGDERIRVETLEFEGLDEVWGTARVDQLGERLADDRCGLEAVRAPARRHMEVVDLGLAEDRAVVGGDVAQPGPRAQHPRVLELGEELAGVARRFLQEVQRALHAIGRPRLDLRADQ